MFTAQSRVLQPARQHAYLWPSLRQNRSAYINIFRPKYRQMPRRVNEHDSALGWLGRRTVGNMSIKLRHRFCTHTNCRQKTRRSCRHAYWSFFFRLVVDSGASDVVRQRSRAVDLGQSVMFATARDMSHARLGVSPTLIT